MGGTVDRETLARAIQRAFDGDYAREYGECIRGGNHPPSPAATIAADVAIRLLTAAPDEVVVAEGRIDSKRCAVVDADDYTLVWMSRGRFHAFATQLDCRRVAVIVRPVGGDKP